MLLFKFVRIIHVNSNHVSPETPMIGNVVTVVSSRSITPGNCRSAGHVTRPDRFGFFPLSIAFFSPSLLEIPALSPVDVGSLHKRFPPMRVPYETTIFETYVFSRKFISAHDFETIVLKKTNVFPRKNNNFHVIQRDGFLSFSLYVLDIRF